MVCLVTQKDHPEQLLPKTRLSSPQHIPTLNVFLKPKLQRYSHYGMRGRRGYPQVSFPFISGCVVTRGEHGHPPHTPCCLERGAGEYLATMQVGSGLFGKITEAVGGAHCLGAIRYGAGGHLPVHRASVAGMSARMPEVALLITFILPGRDETTLCFKEHPQPYQRDEIS